MDYPDENLTLISSPWSELESCVTNIVERSTSLVSPSLKFGEDHKSQDAEDQVQRDGLTVKSLNNGNMIDLKNDFELLPHLVVKNEKPYESTSLKFHSKAKVLVYNHDSDCKSIRKVFSPRKSKDGSPLKRINKSISRRFSGLGVSSSTTESKENLVHSRRDRSILKNKVNVNEEQESVRANNCDEVQVEDFLCFVETHERRRMDTEPFLEHFREKQIENYYENI
ncbi:hypothetical protein KL930_001110 [Ogataea haglerorum]|uniref:Uncharacterized protein n=1 Tax=Ogataea haglerorum TaxID=1937702 RepID=A0AAN6D9X1_9ASCO|nr:uncharacterized protein KL911_001319 [Ogataea haglerorum]KAG7700422.1 hypothetical protein KL915_001111 [Ogataea haglerorum]KAG7711895.1 hypothetical protein KL914_000537 [Ogataea haglerorum]KAG7712666.1 hypothetical protein KL950_000537 [Ogataea haglerorum]KAG7722716.1 hypothetical protein KL913_000536 [Ogataea haglerorum]KAG7723182.1 hypothetical protein KL949_000232 [Ogataea haglerorum]